jgi:hypothetical protein
MELTLIVLSTSFGLLLGIFGVGGLRGRGVRRGRSESYAGRKEILRGSPGIGGP